MWFNIFNKMVEKQLAITTACLIETNGFCSWNRSCWTTRRGKRTVDDSANDRRLSGQRHRRQRARRRRRNSAGLRQNAATSWILSIGLWNGQTAAGQRRRRGHGRRRPPDTAVPLAGIAGPGVRFDASVAQLRRQCVARQRQRPLPRRKSVRVLPAGHHPLPVRGRGAGDHRFAGSHHGLSTRGYAVLGPAFHGQSRKAYTRHGTGFSETQVSFIAVLETAAAVTLPRLEDHSQIHRSFESGARAPAARSAARFDPIYQSRWLDAIGSIIGTQRSLIIIQHLHVQLSISFDIYRTRMNFNVFNDTFSKWNQYGVLTTLITFIQPIKNEL